MYDIQKNIELNKTLNRFHKLRLYSINGYNNLLPMSVFKKNPNKYQQIQLNTSFHYNAIIMDIDKADLLTEWNHRGLPTPSIQTVNNHNNKAHLVWLLNVPIYKEHKHAVDYYKAIVNSIKKLIGADIAYQNHQTKNFLNLELYRVTYNDVAYDLGDFRNFIIKDIPKNMYDDELDYLVAGSRHIHLFEKLRRYGYSVSTESNLKYMLTKRAEYINETFDSPIRIKYIVNSIYNFCSINQDRFKNKNRKRIMKFKKIHHLSKEDFYKEVKQRQSQSAARTTSIKKLKTSIKLKIAIATLQRHKKELTYKHISNQSRTSISTVRRNLKLINVFIQKSHGFIRSIRLIVHRAKRTCTPASLEDHSFQYNQVSVDKFISNLSPPT